MKQNLINNFQARRVVLRLSAFFLILLFASLPSANFGQTRVLTRAQFSRISVLERAGFFEPTISRIALEEGVDPYLLWTIAYNETRFRPWLKSFAGAEGLMQFIPATAARFNLPDPYQPEPAIRAAARYVRFLQNRFGGRIDSILAGYNAGEGAVDAYLTWAELSAAAGKLSIRAALKQSAEFRLIRETVALCRPRFSRLSPSADAANIFRYVRVECLSVRRVRNGCPRLAERPGNRL